jgi:hypothetical protein
MFFIFSRSKQTNLSPGFEYCEVEIVGSREKAPGNCEVKEK